MARHGRGSTQTFRSREQAARRTNVRKKSNLITKKALPLLRALHLTHAQQLPAGSVPILPDGQQSSSLPVIPKLRGPGVDSQHTAATSSWVMRLSLPQPVAEPV